MVTKGWCTPKDSFQNVQSVVLICLWPFSLFWLGSYYIGEKGSCEAGLLQLTFPRFSYLSTDRPSPKRKLGGMCVDCSGRDRTRVLGFVAAGYSIWGQIYELPTRWRQWCPRYVHRLLQLVGPYIYTLFNDFSCYHCIEGLKLVPRRIRLAYCLATNFYFMVFWVRLRKQI